MVHEPIDLNVGFLLCHGSLQAVIWRSIDRSSTFYLWFLHLFLIPEVGGSRI